MIEYKFKDITIELIDEPTYKYDSQDNNLIYSRIFFGEVGEHLPASKHGIKVYQVGKIINSCILIGSGGSTGIHKTSSILDEEELLICCCDSIFCISMPNLDLKWKTKSDLATCFQIFKHKEEYIVHGELQITKLDKNGNIKWEFSGLDIFVTLDNQESFKIENDGILLTDFSNNKYKIDFEGKLF